MGALGFDEAIGTGKRLLSVANADRARASNKSVDKVSHRRVASVLADVLVWPYCPNKVGSFRRRHGETCRLSSRFQLHRDKLLLLDVAQSCRIRLIVVHPDTLNSVPGKISISQRTKDGYPVAHIS